MAKHEAPEPVWREPGAPPHNNGPAWPVASGAELSATPLANIHALLSEAEQNPDTFNGYSELGVIYQAAREIVLASRDGRLVTPAIPMLTRELSPLVHQLLSDRRNALGIVSLPVAKEVEPTERPQTEIVKASWRAVAEFFLGRRTDKSGQEVLFYSSFSWDRKPLPPS